MPARMQNRAFSRGAPWRAPGRAIDTVFAVRGGWEESISFTDFTFGAVLPEPVDRMQESIVRFPGRAVFPSRGDSTEKAGGHKHPGEAGCEPGQGQKT